MAAAPLKYPQNPGLRKKVDKITMARTVDVAECGTIFMVSNPGDVTYVITLPTAANAGSGWHCKFVNGNHALNSGQLSSADSKDVKITTGDGAGAIASVFVEGHDSNTVNEVTSVDQVGAEYVHFDGHSVHGDWIEIWTDGYHWFADGRTTATDAIETS